MHRKITVHIATLINKGLEILAVTYSSPLECSFNHFRVGLTAHLTPGQEIHAVRLELFPRMIMPSLAFDVLA